MALAIDSQDAGTGNKAASASSLTWAFTNTAGNLLVVAAVVTNVTGGGAPTITGVTYNTIAMTAVGHIAWDTGNESYVALYSLANPAIGANNVVVTASGTVFDIIGGAISFSGAGSALGAPSSAADGSIGTHAQAGLITTAAGNYIVSAGGWGSGEDALADQTKSIGAYGGTATAGDALEVDYALSSGSAINLGFTWPTADHWGIIAAAVPVAGVSAHTVLPDADLATTGWTATPLFSKVNDASDATLITATLA